MIKVMENNSAYEIQVLMMIDQKIENSQFNKTLDFGVIDQAITKRKYQYEFIIMDKLSCSLYIL